MAELTDMRPLYGPDVIRGFPNNGHLGLANPGYRRDQDEEAVIMATERPARMDHVVKNDHDGDRVLGDVTLNNGGQGQDISMDPRGRRDQEQVEVDTEAERLFR